MQQQWHRTSSQKSAIILLVGNSRAHLHTTSRRKRRSEGHDRRKHAQYRPDANILRRRYFRIFVWRDVQLSTQLLSKYDHYQYRHRLHTTVRRSVNGGFLIRAVQPGGVSKKKRKRKLSIFPSGPSNTTDMNSDLWLYPTSRSCNKNLYDTIDKSTPLLLKLSFVRSSSRSSYIA